MDKDNIFIIYSDFVTPKIRINETIMRLCSNICKGEKLTVGFSFDIRYFILDDEHPKISSFITENEYRWSLWQKDHAMDDRLMLDFITQYASKEVSVKLAKFMIKISNEMNKVFCTNIGKIMEKVSESCPVLRYLSIDDLIIDGEGHIGDRCYLKSDIDMELMHRGLNEALCESEFAHAINRLLKKELTYLQILSHKEIVDDENINYVKFLLSHDGGTRNRLHLSDFAMTFIIGDLNSTKGNIDTVYLLNNES